MLSCVLWAVLRVIGSLLILGIAPTASAQDDAATAIAAADSVASRLDQEITCLRNVYRAVRSTRDLMREARDQLRTGTTDAVRRDARDAIRSLRQRLTQLERDSLACRRPASTEARSSTPVGGVVVRDAPRDPNAERVARQNSATRVVERDILLVGNVRAVRGEQVDGRGRIEDAHVRGIIRNAASGIDRCYNRLVRRGALVRGNVMLTFTIEPTGRIHEIRTEGSTIRGTGFLQCVRTATRRVRTATGPVGGNATFSYTLQLPAT